MKKAFYKNNAPVVYLFVLHRWLGNVQRIITRAEPLYIYLILKPSARAVLGEYRPEVLTVRTERSAVRTKKTKGRYSPSTGSLQSRASLVNKRFITRLKLFRRKTQTLDCKDTINFKHAILFRANLTFTHV